MLGDLRKGVPPNKKEHNTGKLHNHLITMGRRQSFTKVVPT